MVLNTRPARRILPSLSPNKADRLEKLMTLEVKERLRLIDEITGTVHMWDLTDKGRRELRAKYAEMIALHDQLTKKYESDNRRWKCAH